MARDFYSDNERRYMHDATFKQAVDMLEFMAREHGFTPGELRDIAFLAALHLEVHATRSMTFVVGKDGAMSPYPDESPSMRERRCWRCGCRYTPGKRCLADGLGGNCAVVKPGG